MASKKKVLIFVSIVFFIFFLFWLHQLIVLRKAHSTLENYYGFRGCVQLIDKTDDSATCRINSGKIIKIVKFKNVWYLDGDLPTCFGNFCF